jgi:hypothetical protein
VWYIFGTVPTVLYILVPKIYNTVETVLKSNRKTKYTALLEQF